MRKRAPVRPFLIVLILLCPAAFAEAPVVRTFKTLPSSNGYGAVMTDLDTGKLVHFREHVFAVEEPQLGADGSEVWNGNQLQVVKTRDLLYDAYFGLRSGGTQRWLQGQPVVLEASGYLPYADGKQGGTGIVQWRQRVGNLELTTFAFAPRAMARAGFVLAVRVKNTGAAAENNVSVFSLHNYHLGFGRPGAMAETGENGETVLVDGVDLVERGFAGTVVTRPLGTSSHRSAWNNASPAAQNGYRVVENGGAQNLPDVSGTLPVGDGYAHALQFDLGTIAAGAEKWAGVVAGHHGDPFASQRVAQDLTTYVAGRDAQALVDAERTAWAQLQARVQLPTGASAQEEALLRQSATMLAMAQVKEDTAWLRDVLAADGEPRRTRLRAVDGGTATLPGEVAHRGRGAMLASLPPGEWTYAWARDGAYATAALATLGLQAEAKEALQFFLRAESGRFQQWSELRPYTMPPYQISLTRYLGFGIEETDFNDFGPNLEFDGFGLFLWALRTYQEKSQDEAFLEASWPLVAERVADPLMALIDPSTGLMRKDSSIWETHWNGRERSWTYTNLTAARGLCDAAALAQQRGDSMRAARYRTAAEGLRRAIAGKLIASNGVLASNLEELKSGAGYYDTAVLEAFAMGLFDPRGRVAMATLSALDRELATSAGAGWSRNDDRKDHSGKTDLSPWGSEYDSAEWVVTDLRGSTALRLAGQLDRAARVVDWVTRQSSANDGVVAETYDETTGRYKFNAPMIGFGSGAYVLALAERAAGSVEPACGSYVEEPAPDGGVLPPADAGSAMDGGQVDGGPGGSETPRGCGCSSGAPTVFVLGIFLLATVLRGRRRARS